MRAPLIALLLLAGCGDLGAGIAAYEEGRFEDAQREFAAAAAADGDDASAVVLYDLALAALRAGDMRAAETAANAAAERDAAEFGALRDFLLGNAAFARCELAALQASGPEAEPFAFDVAIRYAEHAQESWQRAAASRADWPAARRNVERALLELRDLMSRKAQAEERQKRLRDTQPEVRLKPLPGEDEQKPKQPEAQPGPAAQPAELTREEVLGLLGRLHEKEREKLAARRARRDAVSGGIEKDW